MEVHRIPLESTRKAQEEAEKEILRLQEELAAKEQEELKKKQQLAEFKRRQEHMLPPKVWKRRKIRAKMAARSRARNR